MSEDQANTPVAPSGPTALKRGISPALLLLFIVGDMLGGGIYALVGEVAAVTGGAVWSAFLLALTLALFTAFAYAELVTKYPRAGGAAYYVHRAFQAPFLSFLVAFAVVMSGVTSASALAMAFGDDYLAAFFDPPTVLVAMLFIMVLALLLTAFIIVNISVLVLRRDKVEHDHFRAPVAFPVLGILVCAGLLAQQDAHAWLRAAALLTLGAVLYGVNVLVKNRLDRGKTRH